MKFSVLTSVYKNDAPGPFRDALDSTINQTCPPDEIVLVRDGQVPAELQAVIDEYVSRYPELFTYIPFEENMGRGTVLRESVLRSRNDVLAIMDSDDLCLPGRFEKQIRFLEQNPDIDVVGGNISEFVGEPSNVVDYRCVPEAHDDISKMMSSRSPFNNVTVMYKKDAVLRAGNYESFYLFEDWYFFVKMYLAGCKFANINDVLCNVRISTMSSRRGGMKYYKSCKRLLKFMKKNEMIGFFKYMKIKTVRFIGYVLLPNKLRAFMYKKMLRKKTNNLEK